MSTVAVTELLSDFGDLHCQEFENSTVCVTSAGAVASIELNRPAKRNALNSSMTSAITQAISWIDSQDDIKIVTFSGRGLSFCAGFDLELIDGDSDARTVSDQVDKLGELMSAIESMKATTVALIHGNCVGGGLLIALACDLRLSTDTARFWLPETDLAIPLACGGVPRLVREIGAARATDLILLCTEINAEHAAHLGLLNDVAPLESFHTMARAILTKLASRPKILLRTTKHQVSAATRNITPVDYAFTDAHLLHAALIDPEARIVRDAYVGSIRRKETA